MERVHKITGKLPAQFLPIIQALNDLNGVCSKNNIWYLVGGSTAISAASCKYSRVPQDVDAICDYKGKDILNDELRELGYKLIPLPQTTVVNRIKKHYVKDKRIIDIAFGQFTNRGFEIRLPMLIPGLLLVFSQPMIKTKEYKLGDANFKGFSKEALWFGLGGFIGTIDAMGEKVDKRKDNLRLLSEGLQNSKIKDIEKGHPGVYLKNVPLVTPRNKLLLYLANVMIKTWGKISKYG